jgi:hypothetical protein
MSRSCSALILLLGLAGTATAQTAENAAWTLASGDFTIFGHTTYRATLILVPRIVYDTHRGVDSARVVDSVRTAARNANGFAAGLGGWPTDLYCEGPASASLRALHPRYLLGRIQHAARCGFRLVLVPPQRLLTTNGLAGGQFSVDSAKRITDQYAAILPTDTLRKYRATILGMNLADDYGCTQCWGGKNVTQAQIAEWAAYTRDQLPGLPLGVRITADWVAAYPKLAPLLDYTWAQYTIRRGDPEAYYDNAARIASNLGLRVIMGVNVHHCSGPGTAPCSAADLTRFGTLAVSHPASCAFISWRYDEATWQRAEIRQVWDGLLAKARGRAAEECRRS